MVEIKVIHYSDNIIIEVIDEYTAKAIVTKEYFYEYIEKNKYNYYPYMLSPLQKIKKRLVWDFNINIEEYIHTHYYLDKNLCYNFHRKIID